MKDALGNEVNIGDYVVTSALCAGSTAVSRRALTLGKVERMTGKGCEMSYGKQSSKWRLVITQPHQTVKVGEDDGL